MISFLCFAHPFTSTQNALCLPILARLNQAHSSGPRPTVTSSTKLFQHFPTPSSPSFELPQHFNHLSKIACITIYYIFLTYRPRFSTLAGLTFLGYIIIFLWEQSCALAASRVSTHWMSVASPLQLQQPNMPLDIVTCPSRRRQHWPQLPITALDDEKYMSRNSAFFFFF